MLSIRNLHARVDGKEILRGVNLDIPSGEVHAIMGPNGSGKSTLANVLAGREDYEVTEGEILFHNKNLLDMSPEVRAAEGVFLAFQHPIEIPGVQMTYFIKSALNAIRKHRELPPLNTFEFMRLVKEKARLLQLDEALLKRPVNEGFSGGEKKRNEIFQMALLDPSLAILDETDSGLDIDALRHVSDGVNALRSPTRSVLLITHFQRILSYIIPDRIHVLSKGQIIRSGDRDLALTLEQHGYGWISQDNPEATP